MRKLLALTLFIGLLAVGSVAYAAQTYHLYTLDGFVEHLIERGVIPQSLAPKARELAAFIGKAEDVQQDAVASQTPNADKVEVTVSQLIEQGTRTYAQGADVKGLLLLVKSKATSTVELAAKRKCQVVYRIYDENDSLVYDSATSEQCKTTDRVTWVLGQGQTRMFQVSHPATVHPLAAGVYRFELEYPGYGKGELEVTVE